MKECDRETWITSRMAHVYSIGTFLGHEGSGEIADADRLLSVCGFNHDDVTKYQLLVCCLSEQTVVEESLRRLRTKEDGGLHSGVLLNPSNSDATFRNKAGKEHQGYASNLEETVGSNGSVITDYQYEQNNYSDSQFLKDSLGRKECQEEADAKHY